MNKKFIALTIFAFFGLNTTATYANSCQNDVYQMYDQIYQYGSITTKNHVQLNNVRNTTGNETCHADGFRFNMYMCKLTWKMADWGNTITCV